MQVETRALRIDETALPKGARRIHSKVSDAAEVMEKEYKKINGHDPARLPWRKYDYLTKGLPPDVTQSLWKKLTWDDYAFIEMLTEEDKGFPWFRSVGMNDDQIAVIKGEASRYFREVNDMMIRSSRCPLYPHPEDAVSSAKTHLDLLKQIPYEEVVSFYGCEYPDYEPLRCNDGTLERRGEKVVYSFDGREYELADRDGDLVLMRFREPWNKTCIIHNGFSADGLLENGSAAIPGGGTIDIGSLCRLLADAIMTGKKELDLRGIRGEGCP